MSDAIQDVTGTDTDTTKGKGRKAKDKDQPAGLLRLRRHRDTEKPATTTISGTVDGKKVTAKAAGLLPDTDDLKDNAKAAAESGLAVTENGTIAGVMKKQGKYEVRSGGSTIGWLNDMAAIAEPLK